MKRVILAFDSFKGCASSQEIAASARQGIIDVFPECAVVVVPVADGGEGTVEAICSNMSVERVSCRVHDPLMNPMEAAYGITSDGSTAILENLVFIDACRNLCLNSSLLCRKSLCRRDVFGFGLARKRVLYYNESRAERRSCRGV